MLLVAEACEVVFYGPYGLIRHTLFVSAFCGGRDDRGYALVLLYQKRRMRLGPYLGRGSNALSLSYSNALSLSYKGGVRYDTNRRASRRLRHRAR